MSGSEQGAILLRRESKTIQKEIAALEAEMKRAARDLAWLADKLTQYRAENVSWGSYTKLVSSLSQKTARYAELQRGKADMEAQLGEFMK